MSDESKKPLQEEEQKQAEAKPEVKEPKKTATKKKTSKKKTSLKKKAKESTLPEQKEGKKPSTFTQAPQKRSEQKSRGKGSFMLLALVVLVLVIAAGWYQSQKLNQADQKISSEIDTKINTEVSILQQRLQNLVSQIESQKKDEQPQTKLYSDAEIGISFNYPENLGEINKQIDKGDEEDPNDDLITLTFSANPDVWIVAAKEQYVSPFKQSCDTPLTITDEGYCDLVTLGGLGGTLTVRPVRENNVLVNVVQTVSVRRAEDVEYQQIFLHLGLGLPPVSGRSIFTDPDPEEQQLALQDFYSNILKRGSLSLVLRENLASFDQILDSAQLSGVPQS